MRIVIVNKYARVTGGADRHCLDLAAALRTRGHLVSFLSTASNDNEEEEGVFVPCSVTNASRASLSPFDQASVGARALWSRNAARGMERLLDEFQPDVVHFHKLYPQLSVAPVVAAARRTAVVQTLHDYELVSASALDSSGARLDSDEQKVAYRLLNSVTFPIRQLVHARRVRRFIAVSSFVADVYRLYGIEASVLPNFVPIAAEQRGVPLAFREREGVLFAGRLVWEKGIGDVLELARRLPDLSIFIAGGGPLAAVVADAAATLPNLNYVGVLGAAPLQQLLGRMRVLLIPSRWDEPGPLGALEAMAAGTPIVAAARGGLAEYVVNAASGEVVEGSVDNYAAACLALHDHESAWAEASESGIRAAAQTHSREDYVTRLLQLYAEAV